MVFSSALIPACQYVVSGVLLTSPRPLDLVPADQDTPFLCRLTGQEAPLSLPLPGDGWQDIGLAMWVRPGAVFLSVHGLARFLVTQDGGLSLDVEPGADQGMLSHYLCGHVLGAFLHLRGLLPLHASCLVRDGVAVAIAAERGTGKSTLGAALSARGWRPLADDVVLLAPDGDGRMMAWPGPARFRLSSLSLAGISLPPSYQDYPLAESGKRTVWPPPGHWLNHPVPLSAMIDMTAGGEEIPRLERLSLTQTVAVLHSHVFRRRLIARLGASHDFARQCLSLAAQIQGFRLVRPAGFDGLDALISAVGDAAELAGQSSS